jgi:hypothetical protein
MSNESEHETPHCSWCGRKMVPIDDGVVDRYHLCPACDTRDDSGHDQLLRITDLPVHHRRQLDEDRWS